MNNFVKSALLILILATAIVPSAPLYCQTDQQTQDSILVAKQAETLLILTTELNLLKNQIGEESENQKSTILIQKEVQDLKEKLRDLDAIEKQNWEQKHQADNLRVQIEDLEIQITTREEEMTTLQTQMTSLSEKIQFISNTMNIASKEKAKADSLARLAIEASDKITQRTIGKFIGDVRTWADLGTILNAIANTAENLLLFSESGKEPFLIKAGKTLGLLAAGGGTYVATNDAESGAIMAGGALTLSLLMQMIPNDVSQSVLIENIARNRAFTDEVKAFTRISGPFVKKAKELNATIPHGGGDVNWQPAGEELQSYYQLIAREKRPDSCD